MKHPIHKVCLIYKRSLVQRFLIDERNQDFKALVRRGHESVQDMQAVHERHKTAVKKALQSLRARGLAVKVVSRRLHKDLTGFDLVITLGGDGTFLRTAPLLKNGQLILPVNSDPWQSVGALCSITIADFEKKLDALLKGRYRIRRFPLMEVRVNGRPLPVRAINDALLANSCPAATSRYEIIRNGRREDHKSSGLWVATATGSTAAIHAAGGSPMRRGDRRLQFAVREPYQGLSRTFHLTHGFIPPGGRLRIINKMIRGKIYVDGPAHAFDAKFGDEIEFRKAKQDLEVVV